MQRCAVINVVGLSQRHLGADTPNLSAYVKRCGKVSSFRPSFPALTCTAQSDFLTGQQPRTHGIVGNGWYDREFSEVRFWKQSNHIVKAPKIWEELRSIDPSFTCAKLFWWYNMYSSADYTITPRPMYPADGRKVFDIYTQPMDMRESIKKDLGDFPFPSFWGPRAGIESSDWIARSARWIEDRHQPTLSLVYLPHLDYSMQKVGPQHPSIPEELRKIDRIVGELIDYYSERSVNVVIVSEYGITPVDNPIHLNRIFRQNGWIAIKEELGLEQLDCGASKAFAIADHQVAHVYVNDLAILPAVKATLESTEGVEQVLDVEEQQKWGIDHRQSGDLIAISDPRSWFSYYYWDEDKKAPDFARCIDIHRKPGYDPVELFIDPNIKVPALKVATFLAKKKLGLRALLDVIPLDASLVKGSHGRCPEDKADWPVFISPLQSISPEQSTDIYQAIKANLFT